MEKIVFPKITWNLVMVLFPRLSPLATKAFAVILAWALMFPTYSDNKTNSNYNKDLAAPDVWYIEMPSKTTVLLMIGWLILSAFIGYGLYRNLLKNEVRKGTYPQILAWNIFFGIAAVDLWVLFASLFHLGLISVGIPAVLSGVFLLNILILVFLGKIRKLIIVLILFLFGLVLFQLANI